MKEDLYLALLCTFFLILGLGIGNKLMPTKYYTIQGDVKEQCAIVLFEGQKALCIIDVPIEEFKD